MTDKKYRTLEDMDLAGRRVLLRVDINVPLVEGKVRDTTRIRRIAPTVRRILAAGGRPVLLAHLGRPKGRRDEAFSLAPLVPVLRSVLGVPVHFAPDCLGEKAERAAAALAPGHVLLLENTRFHAGEEANAPSLARSMARLGDIYCNDAFAAAHRAHASTEGLAHVLPACAGDLMDSELNALGGALTTAQRPLVALVGGAKISTKLDLLAHLIGKVDSLVIGGAMANSFLMAQGHAVGCSLVEAELLPTASGIIKAAAAQNCALVLPCDIVVAPRLAAHAPCRVLPVGGCPADQMILDAGPQSLRQIKEIFQNSATLIWNGPLGAFEYPPFDAATTAAARHAAYLTRAGRLVSVAGGGDTIAALNAAGVADDFSYISTAGGAFLEWMEGKELPGVAALHRGPA